MFTKESLEQLGAVVGVSVHDLKESMMVEFGEFTKAVVSAIDEATDKGPHR
jgi:hypothetical protein